MIYYRDYLYPLFFLKQYRCSLYTVSDHSALRVLLCVIFYRLIDMNQDHVQIYSTSKNKLPPPKTLPVLILDARKCPGVPAVERAPV